MTLPNFVYVGAPRAGSTWIFEALRAHPQVFVPIAKYVKYFFDEEYHRGQAWYERHFSDASPQHLAVGELTTGYLYSKRALHRIAQDLPGARILVSVRNPIERDWSAYLHMKRNAAVSGSFQDEMDGPFRFISEYGRYDRYLPGLFETFPAERIHVMLYDDLALDPVGFVRDLYAFLGVDPEFEYAAARQVKYAAREARNPALAKLTKNTANIVRRAGLPNLIGTVKNLPGLQAAFYKPTAEKSTQMLTAEDRARLVAKHHDGIRRLETLISRDLSHWVT